MIKTVWARVFKMWLRDSCYEFSAAALGVGAAESLRAGDSEAVIWSRQYPCRCLPCRHKRLGSGDDKDGDCWNLHFFAPAKKHDTSHKKTWTVEVTAQKKKDSNAKAKRESSRESSSNPKGSGECRMEGCCGAPRSRSRRGRGRGRGRRGRRSSSRRSRSRRHE
jgi:hypothetical protein